MPAGSGQAPTQVGAFCCPWKAEKRRFSAWGEILRISAHSPSGPATSPAASPSSETIRVAATGSPYGSVFVHILVDMNQATADVIIGIARGELGYTEERRPPRYPTNWTKYADEFARPTQGEPWCAVFVSWVFDQAGLPLPAIQPAAMPSGFAFCPFAVNYARLHGQNVYDYRIGGWENILPGDIVLFDWERNGSASDHVGIVEQVYDASHVFTIEGNTSPGNSGSQSNGGGVYQRTRNKADVQCVWRPPVADIDSQPAGVPQTGPPVIPVANPTLEVEDVKIVNQLIHVHHLNYGFGKGEADFGQPIVAVVGAVINGPDPVDLGSDWWEASKLANAARAQVSGNKVIVTVSGLAGDCDVYVTAVAA